MSFRFVICNEIAATIVSPLKGAELGVGKSKKVAVKALKKDKADDSAAINDFLHEAVVLKNMQHPNVIKLVAVVTLSSPMYVVIELMDRGSLLSYVQKDKGKQLQGPEIVYILSQVRFGSGVTFDRIPDVPLPHKVPAAIPRV